MSSWLRAAFDGRAGVIVLVGRQGKVEAVKELLAGTHPADPGIADQEVESQREHLH
jgi:hypothetical protein